MSTTYILVCVYCTYSKLTLARYILCNSIFCLLSVLSSVVKDISKVKQFLHVYLEKDKRYEKKEIFLQSNNNTQSHLNKKENVY